MTYCDHIVGEIVELHPPTMRQEITLTELLDRGLIPNVIHEHCPKCGMEIGDKVRATIAVNYGLMGAMQS